MSLKIAGSITVFALALAACASGDNGSDSPAARKSWAWDTEQVSSSDVKVPPASFKETPVGEEIPGASTAPEGFGPVDPDLEALDPCSLVTPAEFAAFAGDDAEPTPVKLEDGEACGFINAADDLRLAIGVVTLPGPAGQRFVPASAGGQVLTEDIGIPTQRVRWIKDHPVEYSNILVAEAQTYDLVLEISSLGDRTEAQLQSGAITLARSAAARIPGGQK